MQLQTLIFDEALRRGIRIDHRLPISAPSLESCSGLRPTQFGLKDFITITQPFTDSYLTTTLGEVKAWPFPQLFRGAAVTLLCFEDEVYTVNEAADPWTATKLTFYDAADFDEATPGAATITAGGGPWHFMDFHGTWMLFNGSAVIWNTLHHDKPVLTEAITIQTGAQFKMGRAVMGGFDPTDFYALADWPTWWAALDSNAPADLQALADAMSGGAGSNWAWWSSIGGGDLLWLVSLDLMTSGQDGYTTDNPFIQEVLQKNMMGLAPMPWQGTILHQRQLGDTMVCYGDGGISALVPHQSPAPAMGVRHVQGVGTGVGIASRSAAGGGVDGHVFVDASGELWRISNALQAERLGYGEIFADLLDNPIVVSHDPHRNEFYIAGNAGTSGDPELECYVLTETGLGKAPWTPTQVSFAEGGLVSILIGSTAAGATIRTHKFFFPGNKRKITEISSVTVFSEDTETTGWQVQVQYRHQKGGAWKNSATVTTDKRGVARMNVNGLEFRLVLTNADRTKADLDAIEVEMIQDGKKSLGNVTLS